MPHTYGEAFRIRCRDWLRQTEPEFPEDTPVERMIHWVTDCARMEIRADVRSGKVPSDVPDFATLHDHVDANGYGKAEGVALDRDGECDAMLVDHAAFWNAVQGHLDNWIKGGGLRRST
jgi:hypothetical protein